MSLLEYYLQYLTRLCEGELAAPPEIPLTGTDMAQRAQQAQAAAVQLGIPEFVRLCAGSEGKTLPQQVYDEFDPQALEEALHSLQAAQEEPTAQEEPSAQPKQNAYEALLDCVLLEDSLVEYLITILKNNDGLAFFKLAQVTVRRSLELEAFLYWLATKELYAEQEERGCVTVLDAAFMRLAAEGQTELLAALLSGDRTTFELFRCDAPELRQLPAATYAWFERNYLDRYYPLRLLMKARGVQFPAFAPEDKA